MAKKPNKRIQKMYDKMIEHGCVVCYKEMGVKTPACIHHFTGAGMGLRNLESFIPLCHYHHQGQGGIHSIGKFTFEEKHGTQEELLEYLKGRIDFES
jgi:hypothetical protein